MPSDFLVKFYQNNFPDKQVSIYSKKVFYKLLTEIDEANKFLKNELEEKK